MSTNRAILKLLAVAGLLSLVVPLGASADTTKTAPFERGDVDHSCNFKMALGLPEISRNSPGSRCANDATSDATTGALAVDLSVATPEGGTLPGQTYGYAIPRVYWSVPVEARKRITITITMHVDSASASSSAPSDGTWDATGQSAIGAVGRSLTMASAAHMTSSATLTACTGDSGCQIVGEGLPGDSTIVDSAYGPASRSDVDLVQRWAIYDASGADLPAGTLVIDAGIDSAAGGGMFQPTIGWANVSVDATVTSITIS